MSNVHVNFSTNFMDVNTMAFRWKRLSFVKSSLSVWPLPNSILRGETTRWTFLDRLMKTHNISHLKIFLWLISIKKSGQKYNNPRSCKSQIFLILSVWSVLKNAISKQFLFYVGTILIWLVWKNGRKLSVLCVGIINNHLSLNFVKNAINVKDYGFV